VQAELERVLNALTTETARVEASNQLNQLLERLRTPVVDDAETTDDEGGADDIAAPDAAAAAVPNIEADAIAQQTTAAAAQTMQYGDEDEEDDDGQASPARQLFPSLSSGVWHTNMSLCNFRRARYY